MGFTFLAAINGRPKRMLHKESQTSLTEIQEKNPVLGSFWLWNNNTEQNTKGNCTGEQRCLKEVVCQRL